jgi:hypothetical protein
MAAYTKSVHAPVLVLVLICLVVHAQCKWEIPYQVIASYVDLSLRTVHVYSQYKSMRVWLGVVDRGAILCCFLLQIVSSS